MYEPNAGNSGVTTARAPVLHHRGGDPTVCDADGTLQINPRD